MTWRVADLPVLDVRRDAAKLVGSLEVSRLAILVGAGVSVSPPSALPSAASFLRAFYRAALPSSCDPEVFLSAAADLRFEAVVDVVQQRFDRDLEILDLYASRQPNRNHLRLDRLARRGALILTTNFDSLIESEAPGLPRYRLRLFDRDFNRSFPAADEPELWHLHGALVDARTGESTRGSITASIHDCWRSRDLFERDGAKARALTLALAARDLLVLGYSGADDYDIAPALEQIASPRRLIWVQHTPSDGQVFRNDGVTPLWIDRLPDGTSWYRAPAANSLAAMIAKRTRDAAEVFLLAADTDDVLSMFANDIYRTAAERDSTNRHVEAHLKAWRAHHLTSELSPYVLALMLCRIGGLAHEQRRLIIEAGERIGGAIEIDAANVEETVRAMTELQQFVDLDPRRRASIVAATKKKQEMWHKLGQPALLAAELTMQGRAFLSDGALDDAIAAFRESLLIRRTLPAMPNLDAAEHDLALALFQKGFPTGDLVEAAEQILRTAVAARDAGNPEGIARAYLLRGRISERMGWLDDARTSFETAHAAAIASGLEELIANCEGELGLCLWTAIGVRSAERAVSQLAHLSVEELLTRAADMMSAPPTSLAAADQPDAEEAARLLAGAFRVHLRRQEWRSVQFVGSNLADCLAALGQQGRSLLAHCTVFQCATKLGNSETAEIAALRIRSAVPRELPALHVETLYDDNMVVAVHKELLDQGWLI
jgi:hypothetical protein